MPGVFISYRRDDSAAYAGRLFDILSAEFGPQNTFMDVDDIKGGDKFSNIIDRSLDASDALLAVIGPRWVNVAEPSGGRRLNNPSDFVRVEIGKALQRGIRVIPVLVGGASLPHPGDLPDNLQALCDRQAVELRDTRFHEDAKDLVDVLRGTLNTKEGKLKRLIPLFAIATVVIVGAFSWWALNRQKVSADPPPPVSVAGTWEATVKYDWGDSYKELFDFQVSGQQVSGTAGFLGSRKGQGRPIWDGKIAGDQISFMTKTLTSLSGDEKTYEDKHYYKGMVKGDSIDFTMVTDSNIEQHPEIHFTANRVKQ
jgi:hypothetical protein